MRICGLLFLVYFLSISGTAFSQSSLTLHWSDDGSEFLYQTNDEYYTVKVKSGLKETVVDPEDHEFFDATPQLILPPLRSQNGGDKTKMRVKNISLETIEMFWVDAGGREQTYGKLDPGESFLQNTFVGHAWLLKVNGERIGSFRTRKDEDLIIDNWMLKNVVRKKQHRRKSFNPKAQYSGKAPKLHVRDHNLWLEGKQLTNDATEELTFQSVGRGTSWFDKPRGPDVRWSKDREFFVAFQTANPPKPQIHLVESSPQDQLQPKLLEQQYAKPGDELPTKKLRLFSVGGKRKIEIPVSDELFENPWALRFVTWTEDGKKFWLHYDQRGHQIVRLVEVESATGKARTLIEEKSDTFIHYSNPAKSLLEQLPDDQVLWASERNGWNHIYRHDADGKLMNAVTSGDWNVKQIEFVDLENEVVWFYVVGVYADQDPYHEHFCRVNFDGSEFKVLTEGAGTHRVEFHQDDKYILDTYSRVDMAPVSELRDATSGELIVELESQNTVSAFGDRKLTTRFSAKGRDGETDIWGIIHWPKDFDKDKKYPVIENIYAGPHDHHVPKSFLSKYFFQHQFADAGMIVVQIDGMGTAWRSKKFHDACYKNLKDGGFPDRIAWMKAAAKKYPQMDLGRVGIYGGSAGGQNAMAALLWYNDFYKVAAADCGCHDNRMDKIWWNEQWMGWPIDESYVANSNMENAHLLKGHLMLTVGELDRNVDPATTIQVVKKLIEHDKDFEFHLIPGGGHGAGDSPWAARKRLQFFKKHLLEKQ